VSWVPAVGSAREERALTPSQPCRLGVNLAADEFKLFLQRIDADGSRTISFDEFARAFKGDDPVPDEMYLATMGVHGVDGELLWAACARTRNRANPSERPLC